MIKQTLAIILAIAPIVCNTKEDDHKLKVMIIDTGVNYNIPEISNFIPKEYKIEENLDDIGHGTHVIGSIIADICRDVVIIPCKYYKNDEDVIKNEIKCINKAIKLKVDIINFSSSGESKLIKKEYEAINNFTKHGLFITAAGNSGIDLDKLEETESSKKEEDRIGIYPVMYAKDNKKVIAISNTISEKSNELSKSSNYSKYSIKVPGTNIESYWKDGSKVKLSGTSMSAAVFTNKLIKKWCKGK